MKRVDLIKAVKALGCELIRRGGKHDWYRNPRTGVAQPVPRHREIGGRLARRILKMLSDSGGGPAAADQPPEDTSP